MVKNLGGNKAKGQARKFANVNNDKKDNKKLRESEDPLEIYAQVEKVLGNGMYNVICIMCLYVYIYIYYICIYLFLIRVYAKQLILHDYV